MENKEVISFDCYGTLIDWKSGVLETLTPLFDQYLLDISQEEIFNLFSRFDREIISGEFIFYRNVLKEIMKSFSKELNLNLSEYDLTALQDSLQNWRPFEDSVRVLKILKNNYKIALVSNIDNDLLELSNLSLEVQFDYLVTSENCRSYKPSQTNFIQALKTFDVPADRVLHVAQSLYHDIIPTNELGMDNVWVNRYQDEVPADPLEIPNKIIPDLSSLLNLL